MLVELVGSGSASGRVALVTLNRPDSLNAWNGALSRDLDHALRWASTDDTVAAVVITGAGRAFCAGADLSAGEETFAGNRDRGRSDDSEARTPTMLPWDVPKPVIAAINGHAVGVGATYPLSCDLRFMADAAKIGFVFARRGQLPELASHAVLPQVVGMSNAADLLLSGRPITGEEAAAIGLVTAALPAEEVVDAAVTRAEEMAVQSAPMSMAISKRLLWDSIGVREMMATEQPLFDLGGGTTRLRGGRGVVPRETRPGVDAVGARRLPGPPPRARPAAVTDRQLELGLLTLGDLLPHPTTGASQTEAERHRSLVDQAVFAERAGFTSVHLGEHHFSDYMLSSPPVVLAAIGERTTSLRLSTAVTLAGNLDPVRVAEDYATVDVLSGGRVELVLGRGSLFVRTYEGFGQPVETARERYDESVGLLHRLFNEESVSWEGRFRPPLSGHTTRPRPMGTVPMWIGAGSRGSAELAADLGCRLMLPSVFGKPELFTPIVDIYRERWESNGRDWADARVGACSHTHVASTTEAARAGWEPYYRNYWEFVGKLLEGSGTWPPFDYDELLRGPAICGSADAVVDRIGTWRELLDLDRHIFMFDLGGIPRVELMATLELFATEVAPQLR